MSAGAASQMLPSAKRPVPLRMRADLKSFLISYQKAGSWVVKDPVTLRYFRFQPEQYKILELLDGQRSLEQIRDAFHREFPTAALSLEEIQGLITDFYKSGLVTSERFGQGVSLLKRSWERRRDAVLNFLKNVLYMRVPGWDPETTLNLIKPFFGWLFHPIGMVFVALMFFSSTGLLLVNFGEFQQRLPEFQQFFGWPNVLYLWLILGGAKIIHEFGHGLSCKYYGGECHEMGLMLLVFSPALYCDVTDSWTLKNKWKRIMIGAAGMYVEILLASFAIYGWWFSTPGLFHHLCLNLFFVSTISTVIFNANPLMRYDGYYMLADFLEIPNLRQKADRMLRDAFSWYCLGIETRPDPFMPTRGKHWFILYAVSANVYRWFVTFAILLFFYRFLKPYGLQSIGMAMATFSACSIVFSLGYSIYTIVSAPRRESLNYVKVTFSLLVLAGVVTAGLMIPLPWSLEAPLVVEPHNVTHVYTITPGELVEVKVKQGDEVKEGDVVARLENFEKREEYERLFRESERLKVEIQTHRAVDDFAKEKVAREQLDSVGKQLEDYRRQLDALVLYAPCDGRVVSPSRTPPPKPDVATSKLQRWHGTPLHPRNLHSYLEPRTHLLSVAPNANFQAVLVVDQADRNDLRIGGQVRIKLDELPDRVYHGIITDVADRHLEFAPPSLSTRAGGSLPTVTDEQGRDRLTSIAYQATVELSEEVVLLKTGLRGRARFLVETRTAGDWILRWLRTTFHFRL